MVHGNNINKEYARGNQKVRNYLRRKVRKTLGVKRDWTTGARRFMWDAPKSS